MVDGLVPTLSVVDPLEACLMHFDSDSFDVGNAILEVNQLLEDSLEIGQCSWNPMVQSFFPPPATLMSTVEVPKVQVMVKMNIWSKGNLIEVEEEKGNIELVCGESYQFEAMGPIGKPSFMQTPYDDPFMVCLLQKDSDRGLEEITKLYRLVFPKGFLRKDFHDKIGAPCEQLTYGKYCHVNHLRPFSKIPKPRFDDSLWSRVNGPYEVLKIF